MPDDPVFHPSSYSEVNTVLNLLLSEVRSLLGEELLGMYLYGSLSLGAFEPGSSDIDFLVVTVDAFAILTMCRALYTLACGEVVSKPRAAAWAREALGTPWAQLIDRALLWRHDSRPDDMTDMLNFVRYTIARCQKEREDPPGA
jgi:predicted nucleotidyltransferase